MDAISQTTCSSAYSWMKMFEFQLKISLKFVPKGSINNNPALFQIMTWRRPGDKPLSEPMLVSSLTHICVTRPQWVNAEVPYVIIYLSHLYWRFPSQIYIKLLQQLWQTVLVEPVSHIYIIKPTCCKNNPAESFLWMHLHQFQYLLHIKLSQFLIQYTYCKSKVHINILLTITIMMITIVMIMMLVIMVITMMLIMMKIMNMMMMMIIITTITTITIMVLGRHCLFLMSDKFKKISGCQISSKLKSFQIFGKYSN